MEPVFSLVDFIIYLYPYQIQAYNNISTLILGKIYTGAGVE